MKNTYVKPEMQVEEFLANQYVAACGKRDGKYIFTCDADAGTIYVYYNNEAYTKNRNFHPCNKKHETTGTSGYYDGFVDRNNNKKEDPGEGALLWLEGFRTYKSWGQTIVTWDDGHASTSLTREQIEVERS